MMMIRFACLVFSISPFSLLSLSWIGAIVVAMVVLFEQRRCTFVVDESVVGHFFFKMAMSLGREDKKYLDWQTDKGVASTRIPFMIYRSIPYLVSF